MKSKPIQENTHTDVAIKVDHLSKTFKVPHEKSNTLKSAAINLFNFNAKGYEVFRALTDLNFEVKKGEFFGIIGKNGSGKSTLLKILAGIYVPNEGTVEINGKLSPFLELGVGFNQELSARDNVFLGGAVLGLNRKEIGEKFDKIIQFAGLEEFVDMKFKNFSSGMQVRLAFALAINAHAEILLMDEVLAVGDTNFQKKCLNEFNRYKDEGKTVVLVSHDIDTVKKYCDRVLWIKDSKAMMIGATNEVCDGYLKDNMKELQNRGSSAKKSSKVPIITGFVYLDKDGKSVDAIKAGSDFTIRVHFKNGETVKSANFGLAIFNESNHYILGLNTFNDKVDLKKYLKQGYFEVKYKNIPLRSGLYYVKAGIWGNNLNNQFDFLDSPNYFSIIQTDNNQGEVAIAYDWL